MPLRRRNQELLEALLPRDLIRGLHKNGAGAVLGARQAVTGADAGAVQVQAIYMSLASLPTSSK